VRGRSNGGIHIRWPNETLRRRNRPFRRPVCIRRKPNHVEPMFCVACGGPLVIVGDLRTGVRPRVLNEGGRGNDRYSLSAFFCQFLFYRFTRAITIMSRVSVAAGMRVVAIDKASRPRHRKPSEGAGATCGRVYDSVHPGLGSESHGARLLGMCAENCCWWCGVGDRVPQNFGKAHRRPAEGAVATTTPRAI